jgi:F-type H+-transporting ATPase subunit gamma
MQKPKDLIEDVTTTRTLLNLTSAFEGIASSRLSRIRNQTLQASAFFSELWQVYSQIRVDKLFGFGRRGSDQAVIAKDLYLLITSEGGLSGDIDERLVQTMIEVYDKDKQDVIVIGHHGSVQLSEKGIAYKKYYKLPTRDQNINTQPLIRDIQSYQSTTIFYQKYVSLTDLRIEKIQLSKTVQEMGRQVKKDEEIISIENYIFEPSVFKVIDYLENSMMNITLSQLLLDSKLAQYTSRFRAMSAAHQQADETYRDLNLRFHRAMRGLKDERLKETINGLRKTGVLS